MTYEQLANMKDYIVVLDDMAVTRMDPKLREFLYENTDIKQIGTSFWKRAYVCVNNESKENVTIERLNYWYDMFIK